MATQEPAAQPESPLDVLSRAASLVESGASESDSAASPSPPRPQLHPKFRRGHETMAATPPPPYSHAPAVTTRGSPEEAPLDFSIRKRSLSPHQPGPPPYKYSNPLRQHSPPGARASQSPPAPAPASSHQLPEYLRSWYLMYLLRGLSKASTSFVGLAVQPERYPDRWK